MSENNEQGKIEIDITIGINNGGPIICGVLGRVRLAFDVAGEAVEIASKMNFYGIPGFIQITETTYNIVKYQINEVERKR